MHIRDGNGQPDAGNYGEKAEGGGTGRPGGRRTKQHPLTGLTPVSGMLFPIITYGKFKLHVR